jgi:hypothetical protein
MDFCYNLCSNVINIEVRAIISDRSNHSASALAHIPTEQGSKVHYIAQTCVVCVNVRARARARATVILNQSADFKKTYIIEPSMTNANKHVRVDGVRLCL